MAQSQPPPSCTPPPRDRHAWYKRPNIVIPAVLLVLGVVAWVVVGNGGTDTSATKGSAAHAPARKAASSGSTKPSATKGSVARPGELPTARLGGTIQFTDSSGRHAAEITVARKKVAGGSASRHHVGLFVRVKALQGGVSVPRFDAVELGTRLDAICCTAGFKPELKVASTLHKGETAAGWVIFDLPKASGRLVMQPLASSEGQAFWVF